MTCAEFEILLSDYVDGNRQLEQRRAIEAHAAVVPPAVSCCAMFSRLFRLWTARRK